MLRDTVRRAGYKAELLEQHLADFSGDSSLGETCLEVSYDLIEAQKLSLTGVILGTIFVETDSGAATTFLLSKSGLLLNLN